MLGEAGAVGAGAAQGAASKPVLQLVCQFVVYEQSCGKDVSIGRVCYSVVVVVVAVIVAEVVAALHAQTCQLLSSTAYAVVCMFSMCSVDVITCLYTAAHVTHIAMTPIHRHCHTNYTLVNSSHSAAHCAWLCQ
jgi:hypothetical protein